MSTLSQARHLDSAFAIMPQPRDLSPAGVAFRQIETQLRRLIGAVDTMRALAVSARVDGDMNADALGWVADSAELELNALRDLMAGYRRAHVPAAA